MTTHTEKWTSLALALENGHVNVAETLRAHGARDTGVDYRRFYVMLILTLAVTCVLLQLPDTLEPLLRLSRVYHYIIIQYPMLVWFLPGARFIDAVRWWSAWWLSTSRYVIIEVLYRQVLLSIVRSSIFRATPRNRTTRPHRIPVARNAPK